MGGAIAMSDIGNIGLEWHHEQTPADSHRLHTLQLYTILLQVHSMAESSQTNQTTTIQTKTYTRVTVSKW
jgi:hypothetical protein